MMEADLHNIIIKNQEARDSILSILSIDGEGIEFKHEDKYPNGLYADFTIKKGNYVKAIIECKGSNIGVNDYVRGIGQVMQYQHFANNNLSPKGYKYDNTFSVYCFPSSIIKNKEFNIGLFKYPNECRILEINEINNNFRLITKKELDILANASKTNLVTISQYYIRDNRLFELYLCLRYCQFRKFLGDKKINRKDAEINFLRKLNTPNNKNWRNAFISLSSLGLIDSNNIPTLKGSVYSSTSFSEFCYEIYTSYINDYINLIIDILIQFKIKQQKEIIEISYKDISSEISKKFNNKKILFMTDSDNRYLSSWLNIMKDDLKCIEFKSRSNLRKLNYNIRQLNKNAIINIINKNELANEFIKKFNEIIKNK